MDNKKMEVQKGHVIAVKPAVAKVKETVEIKKDELRKMMNRIERLEAAASKARLQHFDDKQKKETGKIVNLRVIDGKVILGWSMLTNIVEKNERGGWREDQIIEVTYEDKTKMKMPYVVFMRRYILLPMSVKHEVKNEDGKVTFTGETADGKEYVINDTFVN